MAIDPVYMRSSDIEAVIQYMDGHSGEYCTRFELPESSHEKRSIHGLRLREPGANPTRAVLVTGGVHARELLTAQIVLWFAFAGGDGHDCHVQDSG